jgi:hypothetical protein
MSNRYEITDDAISNMVAFSGGKASAEVKTDIINAIIASCEAKNYTAQQTLEVLSIIKVESNFDPNAVNPGSGATGLGQFLSGTWKDFGNGGERTNIQDNIDATLRLYDYIQNRIDNSPALSQMSEDWGNLYTTYILYHDGQNLSAKIDSDGNAVFKNPNVPLPGTEDVCNLAAKFYNKYVDVSENPITYTTNYTVIGGTEYPVSVIYSNGDQIDYQYDEFGNVNTRTESGFTVDPNGTTTSYTYKYDYYIDANGNLVNNLTSSVETQVNAGGETITTTTNNIYSNDGNNNLLTSNEVVTNGSGTLISTNNITYDYDANNNMTGSTEIQTDATGIRNIETHYDMLGNETYCKDTQADLTGKVIQTTETSNTYDASNNLAYNQVIQTDASGNINIYTSENKYNEQGDFIYCKSVDTSINTNGSTVNTTEYDYKGDQMSHTEEQYNTDSQLISKNEYDSNNVLTSSTECTHNTDGSITETYTEYNSGTPTSQTITTTSEDGSSTTSYTQDSGIATTALSGATIITKDGSTLTVVGDNNCIDSKCTVAVDGDGNQVILQAGDIVSIVGDGNAATAQGAGAQITITGKDNSVNASGDALTLGDNTNVTITGDGNTLSVGVGDVATVAGNNDILTLDNGVTATITDGSTLTSTFDSSTGVTSINAVNADGSYITSTINADGSSTTSTYDPSTGVYGYNVVNTDGSSINYQTTYGDNGSYNQLWTKNDGSSGVNNKSDDGSTLSTTTNADGSAVTSTYDASTGVYGYKVTDAEGNWTSYNTTYGDNGSYNQLWTRNDGSSGVNEKFNDGTDNDTIFGEAGDDFIEDGIVIQMIDKFKYRDAWRYVVSQRENLRRAA